MNLAVGQGAILWVEAIPHIFEGRTIHQCDLHYESGYVLGVWYGSIEELDDDIRSNKETYDFEYLDNGYKYTRKI